MATKIETHERQPEAALPPKNNASLTIPEPVVTAPKKKQESALKSFLSGGIGGICVVLVGHPLDLIKVRMQTGSGATRSVWGMASQTFAKEGVRGLYRGVSAPLLVSICYLYLACISRALSHTLFLHISQAAMPLYATRYVRKIILL